MHDELKRSRFAIQWGGILGFIAHPVYYFVWTYLLPQPYDNLWLRLSAAAICVPLIGQKYWPRRFENYLLLYWHFCLIYVLPFVCTFLAIKNSFSTMWMMTEVMMIFVMALCIDIPALLLAYVSAGMLAGFVASVACATAPFVLSETDQVNLALLPIIMLCSMIFSHVIQKGRISVEKGRALQALAGSIGHEMRNPFGQIKYNLGHIEEVLLAPAIAQAVPALKLNQVYQSLTQSQVAVTRGLQVISMILDEVQARPIDTSTFAYLSAEKTTRKAIVEYGFDAGDQRDKVDLKIVNDFTFLGDETAYLFILFNLIKNALYYFNLYPQATLTITVDSPTIKVRDTGPGIAKEFLSHLFDAFQTSGKAAGTGLGLAYCKRIMAAFGGSIKCDSVMGAFTEFTLSFPVVAQAELDLHRKRAMAHAESILKGKRVLVVDDDELSRHKATLLLESIGVNVDEAGDGKLALDKLQYVRYDLILMDINMPALDGYDTAEKIRAGIVPGQQYVPIVANSSDATGIAQARCRKAGMDRFIGKPLSKTDLAETLAQVLERAASSVDPDVAAATFAGKVVLLAEDNRFNRKVAGAYLRQWGMRIVVAEHGQAALDQLDRLPDIDVVLMDLNMPGLNGFETAAAIRSQASRYQHVPIIALTGDADAGSASAAYAAGMNDFIVKPVELAILREKLYRQLVLNRGVNRSKAISESDLPDCIIGDQPAPTSAPGISENEIPLLDIVRLEELRRIGMLEDLPYYLDKMSATLDRFYASAAIRDFDGMHEALHSALGLSGEAGASRLYRLLRHWYPVIKNGGFPEDGDWLDRIKHASAQTAQAMRENYIVENVKSDD
jgi:two-component system, CAI-1 autoinducer sensor kinase/phosphatase CqsS